MKRTLGIPISIGLLIALDQWVKSYVVAHIPLGGYKAFLPHVLGLTYLQNRGAAFSMLQNQQWLFTIITLVVMGMAGYYLWHYRKASLWPVFALVLIISGGLGNFIDRLCLGYVVDMFQTEFVDFAIFNVADSYLTVGVCLLLVYLLKEEKDGHHH